MPYASAPPPKQRFNALSTIENLLEGMVALVPALLWSLFVLPLLFFTRNPFDAISHARSTQKALPPLLFLFVSFGPVIFLLQYSGATAISIDSRALLNESLKILTASDVSGFLVVVGPSIVVAWICTAALARFLSIVTLQSVESMRTVLLYLISLLFSYASLSVFVIFASVKRPGETHGLPEWVVEAAVDYFGFYAHVILVAAMAIQIGREVWRRFHRRNLSTKVCILVGVLISIAVAALSAVALSDFARDFLERVRLGLLREYEFNDQKARTTIWVDTSFCQFKPPSLKCFAMVRSLLPIDVQLVELQSVSIRTSHRSDLGAPLEREDSFVKEVRIRPAIERGELIRLPEGKQTLLTVELPANELCVPHFIRGQPSDDHYVLLRFIGFAILSREPAKQLEDFRPVVIPLKADEIETLKNWCDTTN